MRPTTCVFVLVCLIAATHFLPAQAHLPQIFKGKGLGKTTSERDAGGTALAAVISSRKLGLGLGLKAILFKPLLLVALAKIKLALLLGKPLALLAIKKLLFKAVLGKLLLKIPLILFKGKALLVKMLALKFALITKGLLGLKAPLAMLFLGACALGSGVGLALALGATLHKLKENESFEDDYEEPYALPPPRPIYGAPVYSAPAAPSYTPSYAPPPPPYSSAPAYAPAPAPTSYAQPTVPGAGGYGGDQSASNSVGGGYGGRRKRDTEDFEDGSDGGEEDDDQSNESEHDDSIEETIDESPEELQLEFEAARTNGNAYIYMAAQFDEQSCGRRLLCEVYQKPHDTLTEDEILLQDIFGWEQLEKSNKNPITDCFFLTLSRQVSAASTKQGR